MKNEAAVLVNTLPNEKTLQKLFLRKQVIKDNTKKRQ